MAITKIQSESLNLADDFAFTGTITGAGGVNTPAFEAYRSGDVSMSYNTNTLIPYNVEVFDTDNCYDNTTNYRFTPNVAGKYFFFASVQSGNTDDGDDFQISIRKNGTTVSRARVRHHYGDNINTEVIVDMNGTTDYIDVFTQWGSNWTLNGSDLAATRFGGYKIIT